MDNDRSRQGGGERGGTGTSLWGTQEGRTARVVGPDPRALHLLLPVEPRARYSHESLRDFQSEGSKHAFMNDLTLLPSLGFSCLLIPKWEQMRTACFLEMPALVPVEKRKLFVVLGVSALVRRIPAAHVFLPSRVSQCP